MKVDYGELGLLEFPDNWTEDQVRDFVIANEGQIRKSLSIRARQPAMRELAEAETQLEATPDRVNPLEVMGRAGAGQVSSLGSFLQAASKIEEAAPYVFPTARIAERLGIGDFLRSFRQNDAPRQVPTLADIGQAYQERGILDAAREAGAFAAGSIVEQAPNIMASVGTAGALGLAQVPARAAAIAAPFITTFPVEAGGAFEEIRDRAPDSNEALAALAAMGVGGVNAALETVFEAPILARSMGLGGRVLGPAAFMGAASVGEGLTEVGQELTTAKAPELFGAEPVDDLGMRLAEAGAAGFAAGGPYSAAAAFQGSRRRNAESSLREALSETPVPAVEDGVLLEAQARSAQVRQAAGLADAQSAEAFAAQVSQIDAARQQALQEGADPLLVNVKAAVGKLNIAAQRKAQATAIETGLSTAEQEITTTASDATLQQARGRIVEEAASQSPASPQPKPTVHQSPEDQFVSAAQSQGVRLLPVDYSNNPVYNEASKTLSRVSGRSPIVSMSDRQIVIVDVNGIPIPFYRSTGLAGKKNVAKDKWYPIFGISEDGWINKGSQAEISSYYGSPQLQAIAQALDRSLGATAKGVRVSHKAIGSSVNQMLTGLGLSPVENGTSTTISDLAKNIKVVLAEINSRAAQPAAPQSNALAQDQLDNAVATLAAVDEERVRRENQFPAAPRPIPAEPAPPLESLIGGDVVAMLRAARQRDLEAQAAANPPPQAPTPQPPSPPAVDVEAERIADELDKLEDEDMLAAAMALPGEMSARVGKVVRERANKGIRELNARREARAGTPEANPFRPNITAPPRTNPPAPAPQPASQVPPPQPAPVAPSEPAPASPPATPPPAPQPEAKPKGRKKVGSEGFAKKRIAATIDDYVSDVDNLTPEEIAQVEYDRGYRQNETDRLEAEARAKEIEDEDPEAADEIRETVAAAPRKASVATETNKTRYIKFRDQLQSIIRNHPQIGILRGDPQEEQRVEDAVLRDAKRTFAAAQKTGKEWPLNFAVNAAKTVIKKEIGNITKTDVWKEKAKTQSLTIEGESGSSQRDIAVEAQAPGEAEPESEMEQVASKEQIAAATARESAIKGGLGAVAEAANDFIRANGVGDMDVLRAMMMRYVDRVAGRDEALAAFGPVAKGPAGDAAFNPKSKKYKQVEALFEEFWETVSEVDRSLVGSIKVSLHPDSVIEAIVQAFGKMPPTLTVINDPNHILPDGSSGVGVAGYIVRATGQVVINSAYIESRQKAVEVALEEYSHLIWDDASIRGDWDRVRAEVTPAEVQSMVAAGYSQNVAVEEAAIRKVIAYLNENSTRPGAIETLLSNVWGFLKELIGFGSDYDKSRNAILRRAVESMGRPPGDVSTAGIRRSITSGLFLNQQDLSTTIAEAQAVGSSTVQTLADIGQVQGELIPRSTIAEIEAMAASGNKADNYAATALTPILKFGQIAEPGFIGAFGPSNPAARTAYDLPPDDSRDLAARAVVRTHLTIEQKKAALAAKLEQAKKDLEEAVADLPKAAEAVADAEVDKHEGEDFLRRLEQFLANQLALARSKDVIDSVELQAIQSAATKLSEARGSITTAIGSALRAFAREMPPQITTEAAMSTWIWDRHLDKSLPPLMSDRVADFLTNPMDGKRNPPILAISLADTINQLRAITQARGQVEAEVKAFRAAYGKRMGFKQAAIEYVGLREKYRNALNLARKINRRVDVTAVRVAGLEKAVAELDKMIGSTSYQTKLRAAIDITGTMDSAIKLTVGTRGPTAVTMDGTMSMVDPLTNEQVIIPLTPTAEKAAIAAAQIERLINSLRTFISMAEMGDADPIKGERAKRDLARLMAMSSPAKPYVTTMLPTWLPIVGDLEIPSVWTFYTRLPWFGKRLAAPNNILSWVGGFAGQSLAPLIQARDYVVKRLDSLRADPDPKAPSQRAVDIATVTAMRAHGLNPENSAHQELIQRHSSRILSQHQTPGSKRYEVGDFNAIDDLEVLPEDIALADAQKKLEDAIQAILKKLPKQALAIPLFRQGVGVEENFANRSISRTSPNFGYKMSRRADRQATPVLDEWAKATKEKKLELMTTYYKTLVLGLALETDPTISIKLDPLDKQAFNELISMERQREIPFTDFQGFIAWLAQYRAAETDLTETEEMDLAATRIMGYLDRLAGEFGVEAAENAKGVEDVALLDAKRNLPPPIVQAMTADNQFVRPRMSLKGPSTWYTYDLVGSTSQEVYKAGLVNLMAAIELSGWMNLRQSLSQSLNQWDDKLQKLLVSGVSHRNAIRQLNRESRAKSTAVPSEGDYATIRDLIQFVDAAIAELQRASQEYISTPADTGFARTGNQILQFFGSQLLTAGGSMVNNTVGQTLLQTMVTGWLGRLSMAAAGPTFAASMVKAIGGSVLSKAAQKIPWFRSWLKGNGPVVDALNNLIGSTVEKRNRVIAALALDVPDVASQVKMITTIPGTYGVIDPRRETGAIEWMLNMAQAGVLPKVLSKLPKSTPQWLRRAVEIVVSGPSYGIEQVKRAFPGTLDRIGNAVAAPLFNATFNEIGFKKRVFDIMARREANVQGWNQPGNPNFAVADEEWEGVMDPSGIKLIRDALAPYGSFEQYMLDWYSRTESAANVATTPFFTEDVEDAIAFEFLKLTNLRTESTTPQVAKGKGLMGFWRKTLSQFGRYGQNMTGVMERRFAKVAGNSDDENKLFAGLALAFMFLAAAILGMELKGLYRSVIDDEPRTAPTLTAAFEDPQIGFRYIASSLASQLPYIGDQLTKMAGGTAPSSPFDLANSVPLLGTGTRVYQAITRTAETGDPIYPMVDLLRSTIPLSKPLLNRAMPGDTLRREAARAVRGVAPSNLEMRSFGRGGRGSPFQPLIRSTINAYMEGDMQGYSAGYQRAIQYQMGLGKDRKEAERAVVSALASRDPLTSAVGRNVTEADEATIIRRLTPRQKNAFLRARSLTAKLNSGRRSPLRNRRKKTKRRSFR